MPRRTTHHLLPACACACAALLTVTGCTAEPTVMDTPTIIWEDGVEPTSPLESDPWVQALRTHFMGAAMAWNTGDFTIEQLTRTSTPAYVVDIAEAYARQGDTSSVNLGPAPFQPLDIAELEDGSAAAITVCEPDPLNLSDPQFGPGRKGIRPRDDRNGVVRVRFMQRDPSTGDLILTDEAENQFPDSLRSPQLDRCDSTAVPVGYFDPRPEVPEGPITEPVRAPLPADS